MGINRLFRLSVSVRRLRQVRSQGLHPHGFQRILIDELENAALQTKKSWILLTLLRESTMVLANTTYLILQTYHKGPYLLLKYKIGQDW